MIQVVTYATHSQGMFEDLMNNSQGVEIKVLGWGKKWTGYNDKLKECYNYINELPDDDIIVIIDGFDSKIMKLRVCSFQMHRQIMDFCRRLPAGAM